MRTQIENYFLSSVQFSTIFCSSFLLTYPTCFSHSCNDIGLRTCTGSCIDWYWGQMMTFCGESVTGIAVLLSETLCR